MFARVLVANRGEIALRVQRTLRRLGVESVAVYSDADAGAPHVRGADRAVRIGPTPAAQSYLDPERIVHAAQRIGAEAVHPGYGFLSESPELVRACEAARLVFVGPGAEAMALLGDKVAAKRAAAEAGVPVLPGLSGERLSDGEIEAWAAEAELPLLLKAAAGGGGKGMRVVSSLAELPEAIGAARREARGAFGDDRLLVERYLEASRHIEVQVIADAHGNVLHLGERECSLQRRHQKVIEEAPSPVVGPELRARMCEAAAALARSCGYVNAGTVELIAERDDPGAWFFLEVNTRLQVEHPVTEAVTGLDLVELQLRVAAGEELPLAQEDVVLRGHAVEARVYAEDPAHGFLPSAGRVVAYREPAGAAGGPADGPISQIPPADGPKSPTRADKSARRHRGLDFSARRLRIDSGIAEGVEVGTDYDPMLAKVIAYGEDRAAALARLDRGLAETVVLGPTTNVAYLRALLARPEVREGALDTGLLERLGEEIAPPVEAPELPAVALAVLTAGLPVLSAAPLRSTVGSGAAPPAAPPSDDPWDARDGWRQTGSAWTRATVAGPAGDAEVSIRPTPAAWQWEADKRSGSFQLEIGPGGETQLEVDGVSRPLRLFPDGAGLWILDGAAEPARFEPVSEEGGSGGEAVGGSLEAPMPGVVIGVRAEPGAAVAEGDVLILLESMKMELSVQSPRDGAVAEVLVAVGDQVARGQSLVALAEADPAPLAEEGAADLCSPLGDKSQPEARE